MDVQSGDSRNAGGSAKTKWGDVCTQDYLSIGRSPISRSGACVPSLAGADKGLADLDIAHVDSCGFCQHWLAELSATLDSWIGGCEVMLGLGVSSNSSVEC